MEKLKCNVIVCGPAIGKTYLAEHDSRFVDIDGMKADYKYNLYNLSLKEKEQGKLNREKIVNEDSSKYAIELLNKTIKENRIALLSYSKNVLKYIIENKIDYCLIYADKDLSNEYAERMRKRKNNDKFIFKMTNLNSWNKFYEDNEKDSRPTYKIKLGKGQYLSDIKNLFI